MDGVLIWASLAITYGAGGAHLVHPPIAAGPSTSPPSEPRGRLLSVSKGVGGAGLEYAARPSAKAGVV
jgi:hypothetical protein